MQPSSRLNPGTITSPGRSGADQPEGSASPRRETGRLMSRSPNGHPELDTPFRIDEFYHTSDLSRQLRLALKPDTKVARAAASFVALEELQNNIEVGTRDAEKSYARRQFADCSVHLHAAKANQVALLGKIDDIADDDMSADKRTTLRSGCLALGGALTKMMMKADALANAPAPGKKRNPSDSESEDDTLPPGSPGDRNTVQESARNTPTRSPRKRARGGQDSPVQKPSSPKRLKIDTPPPASSTTTTTTSSTTTTITTATATAAPPSLPTYRTVPRLDIESDFSTASSGNTTSDSVLLSPGSPTVKKTPQKSRPLSPQPRPRPPSQLYKAPPDFSGLTADRTTPRNTAVTPGAPQPATMAAPSPEPGNSEAGNSDQHS